MNIKELLDNAANKIVAALKLSEEEQKLEATATLEDGTPIFTTEDEWAQGVPVFSRDENGEPVPVADGEYTLATGEVLVVAEGRLAELRPMEEEEAKKDEEQEMEAVAEAFAKIAEAFNAKLEQAKAEFSAQMAELKKTNDELVQKFSETPATKTVKTQTPKKGAPSEVAKDKMARVLDILNS